MFQTCSVRVLTQLLQCESDPELFPDEHGRLAPDAFHDCGHGVPPRQRDRLSGPMEFCDESTARVERDVSYKYQRRGQGDPDVQW